MKVAVNSRAQHVVLVQVRGQLNGEQVVHIVASAILDAEATHQPLRIAKRSIDSLVREFMWQTGYDSLETLWERYPRDEWPDAVQAARLQVERLYPELFGRRPR